MEVVSDVHGAFEALAVVASRAERLLILGDLINLTDYRTGEGITAEVFGIDISRAIAQARAEGDYRRMRSLWTAAVGGREEVVRRSFAECVEQQYREMRDALEGASGFVTFGNVDRPSVLRDHLPDGLAFVDGDVFEIDGVTIGVVGGGIATPLGAAGEVSDEDMARKLDAIGPVDVLCSHLPPAVGPLHFDVITGRPERASVPILEYVRARQPVLHLFGDVHQPQASRWRVGRTLCRNVGYFRATRRAVRLDLARVREQRYLRAD